MYVKKIVSALHEYLVGSFTRGLGFIKQRLFPSRLGLYIKTLIKKLDNRKARIVLLPFAAFIILLLVLFFLPLFSGKVVNLVPISYSTITVKDSSIEIGNSQTTQPGIDGTKKITYSEPKSLYNILFGGGLKTELKVKTSTITQQPVQEIISSGTLKYQYMYCSDGTYRYYTNAQFASPDVGFTHESSDSCAQSNHGSETQLTNTPPSNKDSTSTPIPINDFTVPSCTTTSIPYGINYDSVSWLPTGQTETFAGLNGTYFSCLGTTVEPVDEIIYTGTGPNYDAEAQQEAVEEARQKCTDEYNSAMAQIDAAGAAGSSATLELNQLYSECLDNAG